MESKVKVLRMFSNLANGWSRVMVDNDTYSLISDSNQAIINGEEPLLAPKEKSLKRSDGVYFSKYAIDGIEIMYRYNAKAPKNKDGKKYKHEFYILTSIAKELLVDSTFTEIEFDTETLEKLALALA